MFGCSQIYPGFPVMEISCMVACVGFSCVFLCPVSDIADGGIVTGIGDVVPSLNFTCGLDIW